RIERSFNAPRDLVFEAWYKPDLVRRWLLGPPGWEMSECSFDLRVGGKYRMAWRHEDGRAMGMGGEFREVAKPERVVASEIFDDAWYPGEPVSTNVFTEANGRTTTVITMLYQSKEARDTAGQTGMTDGMEMGYARLDALLAELTR